MTSTDAITYSSANTATVRFQSTTDLIWVRDHMITGLQSLLANGHITSIDDPYLVAVLSELGSRVA